MKKKGITSLVLAVFLLLVWAPWAVPADKTVELKFSHKLHVVDNEIECTVCHGAAETSKTGRDNLMPDMETCGNCHDIESEDGCQVCHSNTREPQALPRVQTYNTKFSHVRHLAAELNCTDCHSAVAQKTTSAPYLLPDMAACVNCHRQKLVSTQCATCHLPTDILKPTNHTADFLHRHGDLARLTGKDVPVQQNCNLCHTQRYCQNCHEGDNLDRTAHPLNYEFTHSLDARGKERECASCHTDRAFCRDCHVQNQVMPFSHTAGWANRIPGDGGRHAIEAASDLESCMSCHEQDAAQVCQSCHVK